MAEFRLCRACRVRKPRVEFYTHTNGAPYLDCKDCWRAYVKRNRAARAEQYRQYDRARVDDPDRKAARKAYRASLPSSYKNAKAAEWIARNPEKRAAHVALNNAVRDGRVIKPTKCERCEAEGVVTAHHHDYSKKLDVVWLCRTCHGLEHRKPRTLEQPDTTST